MADKVVQLVDKDNNNVYPIAGALAQGSVNTSTINDGAVTANKIDFSTLAFGNYSTTEQDTGFTWIDGKKIYKKTINFGALPNATTKNTAHGITNLAQVIKIEGFTSNGTSTYPLPRVMIGGAQYQAQIQTNATYIQIDTADNLSSYTITYVTLYYTKTS